MNAGLNERRAGEDHPQHSLPQAKIEHVGDRASLSQMLESGKIDAIHTAHAPDSFFNAPDKLSRLFADPMAAEQDYFARTKISPPMHLIAVKRRFVEEYSWLPRTLHDAFAESQRLVRLRLHGGHRTPGTDRGQ